MVQDYGSAFSFLPSVSHRDEKKKTAPNTERKERKTAAAAAERKRLFQYLQPETVCSCDSSIIISTAVRESVPVSATALVWAQPRPQNGRRSNYVLFPYK